MGVKRSHETCKQLFLLPMRRFVRFFSEAELRTACRQARISHNRPQIICFTSHQNSFPYCNIMQVKLK